MSGRSTKITSDMDDHNKMKAEIKALVKDSVELLAKKEDRVLAAHIQRKLNEKYGPTWQVVVGEDFKVAFTHDTKHFLFWECVPAASAARAPRARAHAQARSRTPRPPPPPRRSGKKSVLCWR